MDRRLVLVAVLAACSESKKGSLRATVNGTPGEIKNAFVVPHGGRSFHVIGSSEKRDCDWALRSNPPSREKGEVIGSLEVAPVIGAKGIVNWAIVGTGWFSERIAVSWSKVNWPADVRPLGGCSKRIKVDSHAYDISLTGDFEATCCDRDGGEVVTTGPMMLRLGAEMFPLERASVNQRGERWLLKVSRTSRTQACTDDAYYDDVIVNLEVDHGFTEALSANVAGMVVPGGSLGYVADPEIMPKLSRTRAPGDEQIKIDGKLRLRNPMSPDGGTLEGELHGQAPMTFCPPI